MLISSFRIQKESLGTILEGKYESLEDAPELSWVNRPTIRKVLSRLAQACIIVSGMSKGVKPQKIYTFYDRIVTMFRNGDDMGWGSVKFLEMYRKDT